MSLSAYVRVIVAGLGDPIDSRQTLTGVTGGAVLDDTIADGAVDQLVNFAFDLETVKAVVLVSDRALTVKTNDDESPQDTISLAAGQPFLYVPGNGIDSPFAGDVTALYVTNASGGSAHLQGRAPVDATP